MKRALITGVSGQDGSYLAELLLGKGYEVHGIVRRSSTFNRERIEHIYLEQKRKRFFLHYGDMCDSTSITRIIQTAKPDEIYHLAAQSHVQISFETPEYTAETDAVGVLRLLEAVRLLGLAKKVKIYNAATSELYGLVHETPQTEKTPFHPRSPYGVAKLYAFWIVRNYREAYGMYAANGILFNHESERRGENFVTRKITLSLARVKKGLQRTLVLGNMSAKRDWGYAPDYVDAMWRMLQRKEPQDYVIATGETHSVREFVEHAAKYAGFEITWKGQGLAEKGIDKKTGHVIVEIDKRYFRPAEVDFLQGDPSKAKRELGWAPKTTFEELVKRMMEHDLARVHDKVTSARRA
jgi:GDPmannose 4,6-dehydratase